MPNPETDADAILELQRAIKARQDARVPAPITETATKAAGLLKPLNVQHLLNHLRSGRGVAAVGASALRAV
jgi:hypothetical protein